MSDLDRDEAQLQPTTIPIVSTPDDTYTAPAEAWDGEPTRAPLSAGEEAIGFVPDTELDPEVFNDLLGRLGQGLATIIDGPALSSWTDTQDDNEGQPNDNFWGAAGVGTGATTVTVAPGYVYSNIDRELLLQMNSAKMFTSYDGKRWVDAGAHGIASPARGLAVGHSDISGTDYVTIVGWEHDPGGQVRASNNLGASWYDAGTLDLASISNATAFGGFFAGRFFIVEANLIQYKVHVASMTGAWTLIDTGAYWDGIPPPDPTCVEVSPTEIAIGTAASAGAVGVVYSTDGVTFQNSVFPTQPEDGIAAMHWCASHNRWIVLSYDNERVLTATAGFGAWVERPQITDYQGAAVTGLHAVTSLGRTVIVSAGSGLWVSRDLENWRRLPIVLTDDGVNDDEWTWLKQINGRAWAGRCINLGGGATSALEYAMSGTLPSEFRKQGAF